MPRFTWATAKSSRFTGLHKCAHCCPVYDQVRAISVGGYFRASNVWMKVAVESTKRRGLFVDGTNPNLRW